MRTLVAAAVACSILVSLGQAQSSEASIKKNVNIEAQDLSAALKEFARERELYLIFDDGDVVNHRTMGATGTMTQEETLGTLLKDTGLTYRYLDEKTVTIVLVATAPAIEGNDDTATAVKEAQKSRGFWDRFRVAQANAGVSGVKEEEESTKLEEIVVTAQKREERLLDVPISVSVLSGADLDRSSSRGVADVLNQIAGVSLIETQPGNSQIAVRGVVPDILIGTSTTGFYLDEVPFAFITTGQLPDANAFDLSRVEVLRGPQGTLYGANALGGVVRVLTHDADLNDYEGKVRGRVSDTDRGDGNYSADMALNVPLIPGQLAVRAVASYSDLSGYVNSDDGAKQINDTTAQNYRLKAQYKPSEALSLKLGLSRSRIENGAPAQAQDDFITPLSSNQPDGRTYDTYNLIAEYDWSSVSLLSSTSYLDYRAATRSEFFAAPGFALNFINRFDLNSFSQEFRFSSKQANAWRWSAGAIYKDTKEVQLQDARDSGVGLTSVYRERLDSESYALFGELTRSLADGRFELTGGLRYFEDDLVSTELSSFSGRTPEPPFPTNFDKVTGRLVLAYKPNTNRMWYGSASTGFRSGLLQSSGVRFSNPFIPPLDPDSLMTYETGVKGSLLEGVVSYDTAVYYTEWKDIQQLVILPGDIGGRINAGQASGVGVDGSIAYRPTRALTLQANLGWSGLEFDEDFVGTGSSGAPVLLFGEGERVNLSPEWTGAASGSYRISTPKAGMHVVLSGSVAYRSSLLARYLNGDIVTSTRSDAMRILKASVGLESDRWTVVLYGDNLSNEGDSIAPPDPNLDFASTRQRPRTVGLQASFAF